MKTITTTIAAAALVAGLASASWAQSQPGTSTVAPVTPPNSAYDNGAIKQGLAVGLGITLIGVAGTTLWRSEALEVLGPGESMNIAGYTLRFDGVKAAQGPNYDAARATVTVLSGGETIAVMHPEKRIFPAEGQDTVETAIRTNIVSDLYLALGDQREQGRWIIRAYVNPLAPFIWLGALVMALGGFASLWNRLRVASPASAAVTAPAE